MPVSGRSPSGRALAVPATPLRVDGPSGFDPSRIVVGDWIVIPGWRAAAVEHVTRVTPKLVYAKQGSWRAFQHKRETVIAAFADEQAARDLAQQLGGAAGQRDDRIRKAQHDFNERKAAAVSAYDKTAARLVASATEAAPAGETTKIGSTEGESAVGEAETPNDHRDSSHD